MDSAAEALLIIVSATLSVFLIFAIVGVYYIIRVLKKVDRVADKAENVADSVEAAASAFEKTATPIAAVNVIGNIFSQFQKRSKKKE